MNLSNFTENELETISLSMDDYINYDDESLSNDELIGGQSVSDRVTSIQNKIDSYFINCVRSIFTGLAGECGKIQIKSSLCMKFCSL